MRRGLGVADLGDLLERPLVGVLATYREDGTVLLSPVWQRWRAGGFDVVTSSSDVKVRHLRRDPRASLVVHEHRPPFRGLEVTGRVRLERRAADATRALALRYLGEAEGVAYADRADDDTLVRLEPGRLRAWDFADEYAGRVADLPLTGGCLCGAVRFEVTEPPVSASYCHCTRCQRRTGTAASAQARIAPGSLRIVSGEELVRAYEPPDGFPKAFCSACGSALWSIDPRDREVRSIRLGTFDSDPGVRPSYRQFVAYAAPWEPIPDDGLPRYAEGAP